jgi:hypothetical protein
MKTRLETKSYENFNSIRAMAKLGSDLRHGFN